MSRDWEARYRGLLLSGHLASCKPVSVSKAYCALTGHVEYGGRLAKLTHLITKLDSDISNFGR